jgi:hypothetical protein
MDRHFWFIVFLSLTCSCILWLVPRYFIVGLLKSYPEIVRELVSMVPINVVVWIYCYKLNIHILGGIQTFCKRWYYTLLYRVGLEGSHVTSLFASSNGYRGRIDHFLFDQPNYGKNVKHVHLDGLDSDKQIDFSRLDELDHLHLGDNVVMENIACRVVQLDAHHIFSNILNTVNARCLNIEDIWHYDDFDIDISCIHNSTYECVMLKQDIWTLDQFVILMENVQPIKLFFVTDDKAKITYLSKCAYLHVLAIQTNIDVDKDMFCAENLVINHKLVTSKANMVRLIKIC